MRQCEYQAVADRRDCGPPLLCGSLADERRRAGVTGLAHTELVELAAADLVHVSVSATLRRPVLHRQR